VDIGSSFLPSDIIAAVLYAQLQNIDLIQSRRREIWNDYDKLLNPLAQQGFITTPYYPPGTTNNGHIYYLVCRSGKERDELMTHLKEQGILAVFHYLSLHRSLYYRDKHDGRTLPNADRFSDCLLRLPFYFQLKEKEIQYISRQINEFYKRRLL